MTLFNFYFSFEYTYKTWDIWKQSPDIWGLKWHVYFHGQIQTLEPLLLGASYLYQSLLPRGTGVTQEWDRKLEQMALLVWFSKALFIFLGYYKHSQCPKIQLSEKYVCNSSWNKNFCRVKNFFSPPINISAKRNVSVQIRRGPVSGWGKFGTL